MPSHRSARRAGEARERQRQDEVEQRAAEQNRRIGYAPERIEEVAGRHQEPLLDGVVIVEEPGDRKDNREEDRELNCWE
jgi:hypothetical protein